MKIIKRNGAWVGCRPELQPSGESRIGYKQILDTSSIAPKLYLTEMGEFNSSWTKVDTNYTLNLRLDTQ